MTMMQMINASYQIERIGRRFLFSWTAVAYVPNNPTPRRGFGITYTRRGAFRQVGRFLLG